MEKAVIESNPNLSQPKKIWSWIFIILSAITTLFPFLYALIVFLYQEPIDYSKWGGPYVGFFCPIAWILCMVGAYIIIGYPFVGLFDQYAFVQYAVVLGGILFSFAAMRTIDRGVRRRMAIAMWAINLAILIVFLWRDFVYF